MNFSHTFNHRLIPITNSINPVQNMKHYILQQIVDEYTALTNNFHPCIFFKKNP